jgi:hypothetical protein
VQLKRAAHEPLVARVLHSQVGAVVSTFEFSGNLFARLAL